MKRNRFTDEKIIGILKEHEAGTPVLELCRKHGCQSARKKLDADHPLMGSILHAETHQQQQPKTAGANSKLDKTWGQGHSGVHPSLKAVQPAPKSISCSVPVAKAGSCSMNQELAYIAVSRLLMPKSFCFPPVEYSRGTRPQVIRVVDYHWQPIFPLKETLHIKSPSEYQCPEFPYQASRKTALFRNTRSIQNG